MKIGIKVLQTIEPIRILGTGYPSHKLATNDQIKIELDTDIGFAVVNDGQGKVGYVPQSGIVCFTTEEEIKAENKKETECSEPVIRKAGRPKKSS